MFDFPARKHLPAAEVIEEDKTSTRRRRERKNLMRNEGKREKGKEKGEKKKKLLQLKVFRLRGDWVVEATLVGWVGKLFFLFLVELVQ
jgi:hypothetical protein